jgi:hypothetical protein
MYVMKWNIKHRWKSGVWEAHTCYPNYLGGWDQEDHGSRSAWANNSQRPHLQNNHSKMDWQCTSCGREPAMQVWSPEFKLQSHQLKKKCSLSVYSLTEKWMSCSGANMWTDYRQARQCDSLYINSKWKITKYKHSYTAYVLKVWLHPHKWQHKIQGREHLGAGGGKAAGRNQTRIVTWCVWFHL